MNDLRYVSILTLALGLVCSFCLLAVHGEMCSAMTKASAGDDLGSLRERAFTAFQAQCRGKLGDLGSTTFCSFALEPSNPPGITFILQPLYEPFRLDFHVKTSRDAMLVLAEEKTEESSFAWIDIGGFNMYKSAIRACFSPGPTCDPLLGGQSVYDHGELLVTAEESRPFWVAYKDGIVTVGKGGHDQAFMEWNATAYHGDISTLVHVGISAWKYVPGEWVFYQFCA